MRPSHRNAGIPTTSTVKDTAPAFFTPLTLAPVPLAVLGRLAEGIQLTSVALRNLDWGNEHT